MASEEKIGRPRTIDDRLVMEMRKNGVPVQVIADWYGVTRFAIYASIRRFKTGGSVRSAKEVVKKCSEKGCAFCETALREGIE